MSSYPTPLWLPLLSTINRKLSEEGVRRIYVAVMALLPLISLYNCITNVMAL